MEFNKIFKWLSVEPGWKASSDMMALMAILPHRWTPTPFRWQPSVQSDFMDEDTRPMRRIAG